MGEIRILRSDGKQLWPGYKGFVPEALAQEYPNGFIPAGAEYAKQLPTENPFSGSLGTGYNAMRVQQSVPRGYHCGFQHRDESRDGLRALVFRSGADARMVARLREDGLFTSEWAFFASLVLNMVTDMDNLWNLIGGLAMRAPMAYRGVVSLDPEFEWRSAADFAREGKKPASYEFFRLWAEAFLSKFPNRNRSGYRVYHGNNCYDFARLEVVRRSRLTGLPGMMMVAATEKPIFRDERLLGSRYPRAIGLELTADGKIVLADGFVGPMAGLGTSGRDSGADHFTATYSPVPLIELVQWPGQLARWIREEGGSE